MKLSSNAKIVILVLIVSAAIFGLYKFYPEKKNSTQAGKNGDDSLTVVVTDTAQVLSTTSLTPKITPVAPITSKNEVAETPVKTKPEVVVKTKPTVKSKKKKTTTVKTNINTSTNTNSEANDFVPEY
jgi:hypothetical protein